MLTRQPARPLCEHCKMTLAKYNGTSKHGFTKWHKYCVECSKAAYNPKHGYLLHKKNKCEIVDGNRIQCPIKYNTDGSSSFFPIDISYLVNLWGSDIVIAQKGFL